MNGTSTLPQALKAQGHQRGQPEHRLRERVGQSADAAELGDADRRNDAVTLGFQQPIAANDALRAGAYAKTLTFTLSSTTP